MRSWTWNLTFLRKKELSGHSLRDAYWLLSEWSLGTWVVAQCITQRTLLVWVLRVTNALFWLGPNVSGRLKSFQLLAPTGLIYHWGTSWLSLLWRRKLSQVLHPHRSSTYLELLILATVTVEARPLWIFSVVDLNYFNRLGQLDRREPWPGFLFVPQFWLFGHPWLGCRGSEGITRRD